MAISWLFAPYLFNPSGFEWQKTVEDFRDWTNWLLYRGGIGLKGGESWEAWWDAELSYASILYLRIPSSFRIILRGKDVEHHNVVNDMMMAQEITYRLVLFLTISCSG
ncbi:Callose synthase 10 [Camellia lanceoleosa]|uniref:Callose synthase 10 n=1 Tax=Camellia lanceoleosa TaxID=1840588 RepID=A0ACC0HFF4_9ERIC|nr:Callose synthase 10 [Camellia lanceoleosa]